jgi:hypothetical protein
MYRKKLFHKTVLDFSDACYNSKLDYPFIPQSVPLLLTDVLEWLLMPTHCIKKRMALLRMTDPTGHACNSRDEKC